MPTTNPPPAKGLLGRAKAVIQTVLPLGGMSLIAGYANPENIASFAIAELGALGTYAVRKGDSGWRHVAKEACSWTATVVSAVPLALTSYEGEHGIGLHGLSAADWSQIAAHVAGSVLVSIVPNATATPAETAAAGTAAVPVVVGRDVLAPVGPDTSGDAIGVAPRVDTMMLTALTGEHLAALDAAHAAAAQAAAGSVPAQSPAPAAETTPLDEASEQPVQAPVAPRQSLGDLGDLGHLGGGRHEA